MSVENHYTDSLVAPLSLEEDMLTLPLDIALGAMFGILLLAYVIGFVA